MKLVRLKDKNSNNIINKNQLELQYPVNKVEIFYDNLDHSNWLGFTWELIAKGRTLVGIDTNDTDFNSIGKTGGSKEMQQHSHKMTTSSEWIMYWAGSGEGNVGASTSGNNMQGLNTKYTQNAGTGNSGNLQPYLVVAYWRRTA